MPKTDAKKMVKPENAPWDLSIDPASGPQNPKAWPDSCKFTPYNNTVFYNTIGNVGFFGYSAAATFARQRVRAATRHARGGHEAHQQRRRGDNLREQQGAGACSCSRHRYRLDVRQ